MSWSASSLARAVGCPGSFALSRAEVENEWAEKGNDDHDSLEKLVNEAGTIDDDAQRIELIRGAVQFADNSDWFVERMTAIIRSGARAEVKLGYNTKTGSARIIGWGGDREYGQLAPYEHAGTFDLIAKDGDTVHVYDWKTGYNRVEKATVNHQLKMGAVAATRALGGTRVKCGIIYTRIGVIDEAEFDEMDLAEIATKLAKVDDAIDAQRAKVAAGGVPDTRENKAWCKHCPAENFCPSKTGVIRRFADDVGDFANALTPERAAAGYKQLVLVETLCRKARAALNSYVATHGPILLGDGLAYGQVATEGNEKLDASAVKMAARELLGEEADKLLAAAFESSITKKALKEALGTKRNNAVLELTRKMGGVSKNASVVHQEFWIEGNKK